MKLKGRGEHNLHIGGGVEGDRIIAECCENGGLKGIEVRHCAHTIGGVKGKGIRWGELSNIKSYGT